MTPDALRIMASFTIQVRPLSFLRKSEKMLRKEVCFLARTPVPALTKADTACARNKKP